ncbi:unnamed protein product [Durusdinium trenchii]
MYTGITKCFKFEEGLQKLFRGSSLKERQEARKVAEEAAAAELRRLFPELLLPDRPRKSQTTLALHFRPLGGPPLCVTSAAELREANRRDSEQKERKTGAKERVRPCRLRISGTRSIALPMSTSSVTASPATASPGGEAWPRIGPWSRRFQEPNQATRIARCAKPLRSRASPWSSLKGRSTDQLQIPWKRPWRDPSWSRARIATSTRRCWRRPALPRSMTFWLGCWTWASSCLWPKTPRPPEIWKLPWPSSVMLHDPGHEAKGEVAGRGVDLTDPIENLHIERAPAP